MFYLRFGLVWFMVFNATFNNISVISWRSVVFVEETGVPEENLYIGFSVKGSWISSKNRALAGT
jgi:hypothetical protein